MLIPIPNDPKTRRQVTAVILLDVLRNATSEADFKQRLGDRLFGMDVWVAILNDHGNGD